MFKAGSSPSFNALQSIQIASRTSSALFEFSALDLAKLAVPAHDHDVGSMTSPVSSQYRNSINTWSSQEITADGLSGLEVLYS